jgi:hypothetical protein
MKSPKTLVATAILFASLLGCDSSTDLEGESLVGQWDGVGSIYELTPDLNLVIFEQSPDGTFIGTWGYGSAGNVISNGTYAGGVVRFTLNGFLGGPREFEGTLTDRYRMAGALDVEDLQGSAVFRRSSFSASN